MQTRLQNSLPNPLAGLIPDEAYQVLADLNLLSERAIRDFQIRRTFRTLRHSDVSASDAIEQLRNEYPYLQFDTIRKIVYNAAGSR